MTNESQADKLHLKSDVPHVHESVPEPTDTSDLGKL